MTCGAGSYLLLKSMFSQIPTPSSPSAQIWVAAITAAGGAIAAVFAKKRFGRNKTTAVHAPPKGHDYITCSEFHAALDAIRDRMDARRPCRLIWKAPPSNKSPTGSRLRTNSASSATGPTMAYTNNSPALISSPQSPPSCKNTNVGRSNLLEMNRSLSSHPTH